MSNTPVAPDFRPKASRKRAKGYQLEAVAQLSVLGIPSSTIAGITELSEPHINRLLRGGQSQKFDELRESYKRQHLKTVSYAHFELASALPEALDGIKESIASKDIRVKAENSWKLFHQVVPNLVNNKETTDSYHITLNQPHVQAQVGETMSNVAKALSVLTSVIKNQDPDRFLLEGSEALPIPPSQLETTEGEATLEPDRESETDFLTELIERGDD